jgi:nicotinamidase-related amidase
MPSLREVSPVNVVDIRVYRDPAFTPLLVLVDPQLEYLTDGQLGLPHAEQPVERCRRLLAFARQERFPVAFTRWRQHRKFMQPGSRSEWIDGLAPAGGDMIFDRSGPSCYGSRDFAEMMDRGGGTHAVLAGFTGTMACLSTVVDAIHRGHTVTFIHDASASHAMASLPATQTHQFITDVISLYCPVMSTEQWIRSQGIARRSMAGAAHE